MTEAEPSRRQFLAVLAVSLGAAALGGVAWAVDKLRRISPPEAAAAPTTSTTSTSTTSSTTSASTSTSTSTTTTTTSTPTTATTLPPSREVTVICRDAWGALPPTGEFTLHEIERIMIHHTGALIEDNRESPGFTRRHQRYHQGAELGWPDIAYHFLIDSNGHVYQGRRWDAVGDTRTSYDPTGFLLIAAKGNFGEQVPTEAQMESLYDMVAWGAETFGVAMEDVVGHRDFAATACPGDSLYARLESGEIHSAVQARLDSASTNLVDFCGPEATALVAAIEAGTV